MPGMKYVLPYIGKVVVFFPRTKIFRPTLYPKNSNYTRALLRSYATRRFAFRARGYILTK